MSKKFIPSVLLLILIGTGIFFRFYPKMLPFFDLKAEQEVYRQEWETLKEKVEKEYPDLSSQMKSRLTENLFQERLKTAKAAIAHQRTVEAEKLKDRFRDADGRVYLNGIDSYYWLRLLENAIAKGHVGDWDIPDLTYEDQIDGPLDATMKKNVHIWLGLVAYRLASFFNKDVALQEVLFIIPLLISSVIAFASFFVAKKLGAGNLGSFFAAFSICLSPFLMGRSVGEWFDTDIYNVLFPLLAFAAFMCVFEHRRLLARILSASLAGFFMGCYASTWRGWWFIFDIMIVSGLLFVWNQKLSQEDTGVADDVLRVNLLSLAILFVSTGFFVVVFNGFSAWTNFVTEPLRLATILKVTPTTVWPNVFRTVAELGPLTPIEVIELLGGNFFFFASMLGLLYVFAVERGVRNERYGFGLLVLVFWSIGTFYASLQAMRFVLLLVVPLGLAFGLLISRLYAGVENFSRRAPLKAIWGYAIRLGFVSLLAFFLFFWTARIHRGLLATTPQMDDYWFQTLSKLNKELPQDAVIDSWWDFGHWFKAVARRRVLFDGITQNTPVAYWVARSLLTADEKEALGILRMINASGNQAYAYLERLGFEPYLAVETIGKAAALDKVEAAAFLESILPQENTQVLMGYLFPDNPPPAYLIISYDMIGKIGAISAIGNWDFKKVDMWFRSRLLSRAALVDYLMEHYGFEKGEASVKSLEVSLLRPSEAPDWFTRIYSYESALSKGHEDANLLLFENGLVVNLENHHAHILSPFSGRSGIPESVLLLSGGGVLKEFAQEKADLPYSALVIKEEDEVRSIFCDASLAKSMLFRLYYFGGEGLDGFRVYHKEEDEEGNKIYVYEVQWR